MADNEKEKEEENKNDEIEFKIITLGNAGVGKTSIIERFVNDDYNPNQFSTLGISFSFKVLTINKKNIKLKLIDTGGQEKYRSISMNYFKHADVALFVFDLNNESSFESIQYWIDLFNENTNETKVKSKYLIGNKNDLEQKVEQKTIDDLINKNKLLYMSTSAKTKHQIDEMFEYIGEELYDYLKKKEEKQGDNKRTSSQKGIKLSNEKTKPKKKKCC